MDRGIQEPADVIADEMVTRARIRRTQSIEIDVLIREWFERRLSSMRSAIGRELNRPLGAREGTGFLRYPSGGFYRTHRDRGEVAGWPAAARRAASVVVFLNGSRAGQHGDFDGG